VRVTFWGTRGSIPTPGPHTARFGGNTACVEIRCGQDLLIFDAGTGIRELGLSLLAEFAGRPLTLHLFISHTHWDHIQGFPFFRPAYEATATIHVYGSPGQGRPLERVLRRQMDPDFFPVAFGDLASSLHVHEYRGTPFQVGETTVAATYLNHPGMNLGYKVTHRGKTVVYATDHEPYRSTLEVVGQRAEAGRDYGKVLDDEVARFVTGADLYIGEAQYTDEEYPARVGWGHSSLSATVEVALAGGPRTLALFHHDPMHPDAVVAAMEAKARTLVAARGASLECFAAAEGQVVDV
jgi:phosphoribosyl 1,2-cyclic phosphodiesterase